MEPGHLVLAFVLLLALSWPSAVVNACLHRERAWKRIRRDRTLWIILLVFLGAGAGVVYWLLVWPKLRRAERRAKNAPNS